MKFYVNVEVVEKAQEAIRQPVGRDTVPSTRAQDSSWSSSVVGFVNEDKFEIARIKFLQTLK